ncbi:MAG: choice-of-anchor A family protein [Eubacteriales bacterium]|nr:choice-of-anchor A family protein [Eubacteriales bacterium]
MGKARATIHRKVCTVIVLAASAVLLFANPLAACASSATPITAVAPGTAPASATPAPATYTFEDDSLRLAVTVEDASLLPQGARIDASIAAPDPGTYDALLLANGYDPALARQMVAVHFAFTLDGTMLDTFSLPVTCRALLKGIDSAGLTAVMLADGSVAEATDLAQAEEGALVSFSSDGAADFGVALLAPAPAATAVPTATPEPTPQPVIYTYEDDTIRLTVTTPDASLVPQDAKLAASASAGDWAEYAEALMGQGYHEGRVLRLEKILAAFAWNDALVDTSGFAVAYDVLLKNVRCDNAVALVLHSGVALTPDSYAQTDEGTRVIFSATGEIAFALALVTAAPMPATFTFENKTIRLNVTIADDSLLPTGAELTVSVKAEGWKDEETALLHLGLDKARLQKLLLINAAFTLDGEPVDTTGVPMACEVLIKSFSPQDAQAWVLPATGDAVPAKELTVTDSGALITFPSFGETAFTLAVADAPQNSIPATYTYEDASVRLTIDVTDVALIPQGAQFAATVTTADWDGYAATLQAQGFNEARARQIVKITAGFTLNGKTFDAAGVPMRYTLLMKNTQKGDSEAWVLLPHTAAQADEYMQTADGAQATFQATGETEIGLAVIDFNPLFYVYEDEAFRLTVSLPDETLLPWDVRLSVDITGESWSDAAYRLEAQGFDESRVQRILHISASFLKGDSPVDLGQVSIRYRLLIKDEQYAGAQAWGLISATAVPADALQRTREGLEAAFSVAGETEVGLAVTLPGRTAYACENDNLYAVAVLSEPGALPQGAQLTVDTLPITDEMQSGVEALALSVADTQPTGLQAGLKAFAAYAFRFVMDAQEYVPQTGTVRITLSFKHPLATAAPPADVQVVRLAETDGGIHVAAMPSATVNGSEQSLTSIAFDADEFPTYLLAEPMIMDDSLGFFLISQEEQTYLHSPYNNGSSTLGIVGGFHLVGFGEVRLYARVYGNILAKTLYAQAGFGTDDTTYDLSYVQDYAQVNAESASAGGGVLALGSEATVSLSDGGRCFAVNGIRLDTPKTIAQDANTSALAFVDLAAAKEQAQSVSDMLAGYADGNIDASFTNRNKRTLTLTSPSAVGVYRFDAHTVTDYARHTLYLEGFTSTGEGCIILNVDCTGVENVTLPPINVTIDDVEASAIGQNANEPCRVLWNFYHCEGVTIVTNTLPGSVLALGATVQVAKPLGGTVIAQNIEVNAETFHSVFQYSLDAVSEEDAAPISTNGGV